MGFDDDDEPTPVTPDPCQDCGAQSVIIGINVPPPGTSDIWATIFAVHCVKAPHWRWCSRQGHLSIWIQKTPTVS
jgi:hypothetical protein